jgi:hypothetical protein
VRLAGRVDSLTLRQVPDLAVDNELGIDKKESRQLLFSMKFKSMPIVDYQVLLARSTGLP